MARVVVFLTVFMLVGCKHIELEVDEVRLMGGDVPAVYNNHKEFFDCVKILCDKVADETASYYSLDEMYKYSRKSWARVFDALIDYNALEKHGYIVVCKTNKQSVFIFYNCIDGVADCYPIRFYSL